MGKRIVAAFLLLVLGGVGAAFLTSCGYGPIGTCRTKCKLPEVRDIFCGCYVPAAISPPPPPPPGAPYLDFKFVDSTNCGSLQRDYYAFNPGERKVELSVNFRVKDSTGSHRESMWIPINARATTFAMATRIGYEGVGAECFDKDYQRGSWRDALSKMDGVEEYLLTYRGLPASDFGTFAKAAPKGMTVSTTPRAIPDLDCVSLCNSSPPAPECYGTKASSSSDLDTLKQKLIHETDPSKIDWTTLFKPLVGSGPADCKREDVVAFKDQLTNVGLMCAYPFGKPETGNNPIGIIHLLSRVAGNIEKPAGRPMIVRSPNVAEAPLLAFRAVSINDDYGGSIVKITADSAGVYYQTTAPACIAVRTE